MGKFNWEKCPSVCRNNKYFYFLRWKEKRHAVVQLFEGPWVYQCGVVIMPKRFKSEKEAKEHVEGVLSKDG